MTNSFEFEDFNSKINSILSKCFHSTQQVQLTECPTAVSETICVQANITITPTATVGDVESYCIGLPVIEKCPGEPELECVFTVSQKICVQIPLYFSANAAVIPTGIVCSTPEAGSCPSTRTCTYSIGFFRSHPNIVKVLISTAGGSIILGIGNMGLSFTVTASNVGNVLSLKTPSPPAPSSPPFNDQYQNLYAQLLAANLNILNKATCDYASKAINAANTFLANSPVGGMSGAPAIQTPLKEFNEGIAPGCPTHCPGI